MTAYASPAPPTKIISSNTDGTAFNYLYAYQLSVTAVNLPVRIIKVAAVAEALVGANIGSVMAVARYDTGGIAGGKGDISPVPLRQNSPAASAVCKWGSLNYILANSIASFVSTPITFPNNPIILRNTTTFAGGDYSFPADYVMSPGSTFAIMGAYPIDPGGPRGGGPTIAKAIFSQAVIYFEEIRLTWSG